ncbi:hypothetical protein ABK040_011955 [Willaertia magna]
MQAARNNAIDYEEDCISPISSSFKSSSMLTNMKPSKIHKKKPTKERVLSTFIRRFIYNSKTTKILQKEDTVMINIDDELSILHSLDPQLHGKLAIIKDIVGDDLELELIPDENDFITEEELSNRNVLVPSFCVCLEDRILKKRLTNLSVD